MGMKMVRVRQATCIRCTYSWLPRKPGRPTKCPSCFDGDWDKKRIYRKKGTGKKRAGKKKKKA